MLLEQENFMFLENDEFIIFMAHNSTRVQDSGDSYHVHSVGERIAMREVGIKTSHEQPAWNTIEPSKDNYNSDYLDGIILTNREAGMKSLIQLTGWRNPAWMPDDWFCKTKEGKVERECLSFWNEEAQQYSDDFYKLMINSYKRDKDIMFFFGEYQGGEGALAPTWCIYDNAALEDYKKVYGNDAVPVPDSPETLLWLGDSIIKHYIRKAKIFYDAYKEIWNAQQYLMDTWTRAFGNFVQSDTLIEFRNLWPDITIMLLQYTYFDSSHKADNEQFVDMLRNETGCEVIAEALFAKGLPTTAPRAIAKGFRGQILHPTMGSFSNEGLTAQILDNIKIANRMWLDSRGL